MALHLTLDSFLDYKSKTARDTTLEGQWDQVSRLIAGVEVTPVIGASSRVEMRYISTAIAQGVKQPRL